LAVRADTGFPVADADHDFLRARRRAVLALLVHRLRRQPAAADRLLSLGEEVAALGYRGERSLGLCVVPLGTIVGTVDNRRDFDRAFRPTSSRARERWERLAVAQRRGESLPPIEVYRVGERHFVRDGHHRVSVAAATGQDSIEAYVTEVDTSRSTGEPGSYRQPSSLANWTASVIGRVTALGRRTSGFTRRWGRRQNSPAPSGGRGRYRGRSAARRGVGRG
jgi:hypothetical protein